MCLGVGMCISTTPRMPKEEVRCPEAGVKRLFMVPSVDASIQTLVFSKIVYTLNPNHLSSPQILRIFKT